MMGALLGVLVAILVLPAVAGARTSAAPTGIAPPGNSAVNQYLETVPTANGGRPARGISAAGAPSSGSAVLTAAARRALVQQGAAGRALATLVADTAGTGQGHVSTGQRARGPLSDTRHRAGAAGSGGKSPLRTLAQSVTGSTASSVGSLTLPAILTVIALAGAALAVRRRSRS